MIFEFNQIASWPPLSWLAQLERDQDIIKVWHGTRVELRDDGFCEAVWAGNFSALDFDTTDLIFGSGCRLREERAIFVSSGTTVDRLHVYRGSGSTCISNSLVCIAEFNDVEFDPTYPRYQEDFWSIENGLDRATTELQTSKGPITLVYFRNLVWDRKLIATEDKPLGNRQFTGFECYESFLTAGIQRLTDNMASDERIYPYEPLGTLSTGYDSSTVAVLGLGAACSNVICFRNARGGHDDDGHQIGERLGLEAVAAGRDDWRQLEMAEIPFIASNAHGEEVQFAAVSNQLRGKLLFTGFHGDVVWGKELLDSGTDIVRGDCTGLSLTEFRLWHGFIHCPIPFWGSRNAASINAISNSDEMAAWDIPGDYSRPICRRIVEDAGIPREYFGMMKKAASTIFKWEVRFLSPGATASYSRWLRQHRSLWLQKGELPPQWRPHLAVTGVVQVVDLTIRILIRLGLRRVAARLRGLRKPSSLPFVFPWAMHHARQRYRADPISKED